MIHREQRDVGLPSAASAGWTMLEGFEVDSGSLGVWTSAVASDPAVDTDPSGKSTVNISSGSREGV